MTLLRLSVVASALIAAGCTTVSPPDNTYAFRPGTGTVENVRDARVAIPGGTAPKTPLQDMTRPRWMDGYQLSLRMDDGTTQAITQDSSEFRGRPCAGDAGGSRAQSTRQSGERRVRRTRGQRHHPVGDADQFIGAAGELGDG